VTSTTIEALQLFCTYTSHIHNQLCKLIRKVLSSCCLMVPERISHSRSTNMTVLTSTQAKELVTRVTSGLTQFTLRQCRRDLRTLVYLLTGRNTLNRHLTIMRRVNDPLCPLCKEKEETSLHFLGKCCARANTGRLHFTGSFPVTERLKTGTLDYSLEVCKNY